jgi:hypothetical protein
MNKNFEEFACIRAAAALACAFDPLIARGELSVSQGFSAALSIQ